MVDEIKSSRLGIIEVSGHVVRETPEVLEPIFKEGAIPTGIEYDTCTDIYRYRLIWKRFKETRHDCVISRYTVEFGREGDMHFIKGVS